MKENHSSKQTVYITARIISPVICVLLWYVLAFFINAQLILPYPHAVLIRLFQLVKTHAFWLSFLFTLLRVMTAFGISLVTGFFAGLFCADSLVFKNLMQFPLGIIRATPLIAFILITLFWFKSGTVPVFTAVIMSLPVMITASEKGFEKNPENTEKLFKASCYGFTGIKAFCYIRFPAAMPAILSGAESSFGLCWKVVAAGEVLSIPRYAAGSLMQKAQVHLETCDVLAITTTLVVFSIIIQYLLSYIIKICGKKHAKTV